jgi:uncharacterized membrane protein YgcG
MNSRIAARHGARRHRHGHGTGGWSRSSAQVDARVVVAVVGILFGGLAIGAALTLYRLLAPPRLPAGPWSTRAILDATRVPDDLPSLEARVYPYSVVPGGVQSGADVARAMAADPVVATHYATVRVAGLRRVRLARPRDVSVSYRVGDRVYWTRKMARLPAGEEVLTDGRTQIRPRCGNGIASRPPGETRGDEPTTATLDTPIVPAGEGLGSPLRDPLTAFALLAGPSAWALPDAPAGGEGDPASIAVPGVSGGAGPAGAGQTAIHVAGGLPVEAPRGGGWIGGPGGGPGGGGGAGGGPGGGGPGSGGGPGGHGPKRVPEPVGLVAVGLAGGAWLRWRAALSGS